MTTSSSGSISSKAPQRLYQPPFAYEWISSRVARLAPNDGIGIYRIYDANNLAICFCYVVAQAEEVVKLLNKNTIEGGRKP